MRSGVGGEWRLGERETIARREMNGWQTECAGGGREKVMDRMREERKR